MSEHIADDACEQHAKGTDSLTGSARGGHLAPFVREGGLYKFTFHVHLSLCTLLALRPTAGQRTLDPLMVVRIHQGQLDLRKDLSELLLQFARIERQHL